MSGPISIPMAGRLKCDKIEESLAAIRDRKGGRPAWRRAGRDFPTIARERTAQSLGFNGARILGHNRG